MVTTNRAPGEAELFMREMSRGMEGDVSLALQMLGRRQDELAARIDHLEAETVHVEPPVPLQQIERYEHDDQRTRLGELAADRREINLR